MEEETVVTVVRNKVKLLVSDLPYYFFLNLAWYIRRMKWFSCTVDWYEGLSGKTYISCRSSQNRPQSHSENTSVRTCALLSSTTLSYPMAMNIKYNLLKTGLKKRYLGLWENTHQKAVTYLTITPVLGVGYFLWSYWLRTSYELQITIHSFHFTWLLS